LDYIHDCIELIHEEPLAHTCTVTLQNLDKGVRYCGESGVPQIPEPWTRNFLFRIPSEMSDLTKSFDVRRSGDIEKHIVEFKLKIKMGEMSSYKDFPPMRFEDSYLEEPIVLKWVNLR